MFHVEQRTIAVGDTLRIAVLGQVARKIKKIVMIGVRHKKVAPKANGQRQRLFSTTDSTDSTDLDTATANGGYATDND